MSSRHYLAWCVERSIATVHIQPGRPMQNGHVESFHGRFRDECLDASCFSNLWDARRKIHAWRKEYNQRRPHSALGYRTPAEFARCWENAASPFPGTDTAPPELSQGQALRAPAAALTQPRLRSPDVNMKAKRPSMPRVLYNYLDGKTGHVSTKVISSLRR